MSRVHPTRSRPGGGAAPAPAPSRAPTGSRGVPRFLEARPRARRAGAEREADAAAATLRDDAPGPRLTPLSGPASPRAAAIGRGAGPGRPLDPGWQATASARYGVDGTSVRVHDDRRAADLARGLGANAVTVGRDVFFGEGRYAPDTPEGDRVLGHELAHVAQQGGEPRAVQCDLGMSLPVTLGAFDIDMVAQAASATSNAGLMGTVAFDPDPSGPYSAEIGLVQAVNVTDVGGATTTAGRPLDWSNDVPGGGAAGNPEADRMELMTQGGLGAAAPEGWFIDSRTAGGARGSQVGPNYIEHFISPPPVNQFGFLRSPTDVQRASLWDFPQSPHDVDFDFETVAKGTDNQTVYGSIFWGFGIRTGAVSGEYVRAQDGASAVFEEALERFRGFFVHEPVVLYFDTNQEIPQPGEEAKLADVPDYLDRYPDVEVTIDGFADLRGSESDNFDLAQRRADAVQTLLLSLGVDGSRIAWSFGMGETTDFSQHGAPSEARQRSEEGLLRANRRVVVSFSHTVSGHPIVNP